MGGGSSPEANPSCSGLDDSALKYSNPKLPEPTAPTAEGRSFLMLLAGVGAIVGVLIVASLLISDWVAVRIPFSAEQRFLGPVGEIPGLGGRSSERAKRADEALKALGRRVAERMDLEPGMTITVHYVDTATVNAVATLGGNIFVYRGLIEKLTNEDQLAAVLAHEIGHVKKRHVIRALSRGVALVAALGAVGVKSRGINEWALGQGSKLTALSYSRQAEQEADALAFNATYRLYGNVGGMLDLFALFSRLGNDGVEMLQSHPVTAHRQRDIAQLAKQHGYPTDGARHPLPEALLAVKNASGNTPAAGRDTALP